MSTRKNLNSAIIIGGLLVTGVSMWTLVSSTNSMRNQEERSGEVARVDTNSIQLGTVRERPTHRSSSRDTPSYSLDGLSEQFTDRQGWTDAIDRAIESGNLEEVKRLEIAAWNDELERHEAEPVDAAFVNRVEASVEETMLAITLEGVRFEGVTCRSLTCRGRFSFDNFNIAVNTWDKVLGNGKYGYNQLRMSMTLPEPEDVTTPYEGSVILDFTNVVF